MINRTRVDSQTPITRLLQVAIKLLRGLCALWALPVDTVEQHTSLQKPALIFGPSAIHVGRATLPLIDTGVAARTCHTLQSAIEHKVRLAWGFI